MVKFVGEFLRQTVQLKRQGTISEEVTANILKRIAEWVRGAIQRIKDSLPGVYRGDFGSIAKDTVEQIEATLDSLAGKPPAAPGKIEADTREEFPSAVDPALRKQMIEDALEASKKNPDKRLAIFEAARRKIVSMMDENRAVIDSISASQNETTPEAAIQQIENERLAATADLYIEEQAAIEEAGQKTVAQFADRIEGAKTQATKSALEREAKARAVERKRAVETQFSEKRTALNAEYDQNASQAKGMSRLANTISARENKAKISREKLLQSIGILDALLEVFPPEIRGKVGGFATLANIGTGEKAHR